MMHGSSTGSRWSQQRHIVFILLQHVTERVNAHDTRLTQPSPGLPYLDTIIQASPNKAYRYALMIALTHSSVLTRHP